MIRHIIRWFPWRKMRKDAEGHNSLSVQLNYWRTEGINAQNTINDLNAAIDKLEKELIFWKEKALGFKKPHHLQ